MEYYNICPWCKTQIPVELFSEHTMDCESSMDFDDHRVRRIPQPLISNTSLIQRQSSNIPGHSITRMKPTNSSQPQPIEKIKCLICGIEKTKTEIDIHSSFCRENHFFGTNKQTQRPSLKDEQIKCFRCNKLWSYLLIDSHRLTCTGIALRPRTLSLPKKSELKACILCEQLFPSDEIDKHVNLCMDSIEEEETPLFKMPQKNMFQLGKDPSNSSIHNSMKKKLHLYSNKDEELELGSHLPEDDNKKEPKIIKPEIVINKPTLKIPRQVKLVLCQICFRDIEYDVLDAHIRECLNIHSLPEPKIENMYSIKDVLIHGERLKCNVCGVEYTAHNRAKEHFNLCITRHSELLKTKLTGLGNLHCLKYYTRVFEIFQFVSVYTINGNRITWLDVFKEIDICFNKNADVAVNVESIYSLKDFCTKKQWINVCANFSVQETLDMLHSADKHRMYSLYIHCLVWLSIILLDTQTSNLEGIYMWKISTSIRIQIVNVYWIQRYSKITGDYELVFRLIDICITDENHCLIDKILENCILFHLQSIATTFIYAIRNYGHLYRLINFLLDDIIKKYNLLWILDTREYLEIDPHIRISIENRLASLGK